MFDEFGEFIRQQRREMHLTPARLAAQAGISEDQLVRYERGTDYPPIDVAGRLLGALGLTFDLFAVVYRNFRHSVANDADCERAEEALRDTAAEFAGAISPLMRGIPMDAQGVQLDFPRHLVVILPKPGTVRTNLSEDL